MANGHGQPGTHLLQSFPLSRCLPGGYCSAMASWKRELSDWKPVSYMGPIVVNCGDYYKGHKNKKISLTWLLWLQVFTWKCCDIMIYPLPTHRWSGLGRMEDESFWKQLKYCTLLTNQESLTMGRTYCILYFDGENVLHSLLWIWWYMMTIWCIWYHTFIMISFKYHTHSWLSVTVGLQTDPTIETNEAFEATPSHTRRPQALSPQHFRTENPRPCSCFQSIQCARPNSINLNMNQHVSTKHQLTIN